MNFCSICGKVFEPHRKSKLCCSPECEKIRKSLYDSDRYLEFRNANRKKRRDMLLEKYAIDEANKDKLDYVCDNCLEEFFWNYQIFSSYQNSYASIYNATEDGKPCCPNCGMVHEKTIIEKDAEDERSLVHVPQIKKEAIYLSDNKIDWYREAETIRKKVNKIHNKGEVNKDELI